MVVAETRRVGDWPVVVVGLEAGEEEDRGRGQLKDRGWRLGIVGVIAAIDLGGGRGKM